MLIHYKDLIPTPGNGSSIHGRTRQQVRSCMGDLEADPAYIEKETRQQGERRPDQTGPDSAERRQRRRKSWREEKRGWRKKGLKDTECSHF
ncbi:hypothetical protein TNCT_443491 [Trichonephila clavata]|uniref:Uncharacterized protein n=1 Tax=Trichonephila clavata TaxID=2740835 RepID=A0A8X6LDU9_TRICU|nr:hypothetical protein TNCT_443491 [Trichonephila clavata]